MTKLTQPRTTAVVAVALIATTFAAGTALYAQDSQAHTGPMVSPTRSITVDAATTVMPPDVRLPDAATSYKVPTNPFRPTMPDAAYQAAKHAVVAAWPQTTKRYSGDAAIIQPDVVTVKKFKGLDENASADLGVTWNPSDSNGAVGLTQYVEATNSHVAVYTKAGVLKKSTPLSQFFGYTTEAMYQPCVKYDPIWNRWLVTCTSYPESATAQYLHIAISTTDNATGPFYVYKYNVEFDTGDLWDYQKIGLTQDAVLFDANVFNGGYQGATFFAASQGRSLQRPGLYFSNFSAPGGTLTLPVIGDNDDKTYLIYNQPGTPNIGVYILYNATYRNRNQLGGPFNVMSASRTTCRRTQSNQAQRRRSTPSTPGSKTTRIRPARSSMRYTPSPAEAAHIQSTSFTRSSELPKSLGSPTAFYASDTSDDFNPSVAVNNNGSIGVEWNATMDGVHNYASIYVNGATANNTLPPGGYFVATSPTV